MNNSKKIVSFVLRLLIGINIFIILGLFFINTTLLNEKYYINIIQQKHIEDEIYKNANENYRNVLQKYNVKMDDMDDIITKEEVLKNLSSNVTDIIGYLKDTNSVITTKDTLEYENRLENRLIEYFKQNNIEMNDTTIQIKENIKKEVTKSISSSTQIISTGTLSSISGVEKAKSICTIINSRFLLLTILLIEIFLVIVHLVLWKSKFEIGLSLLGRLFVKIGIVSMVVFYSGYYSKNYNNPPLIGGYLKDLIGATIGGYFINMCKISAIITGIGVVILISKSIFSNRNKKVKAKNKFE